MELEIGAVTLRLAIVGRDRDATGLDNVVWVVVEIVGSQPHRRTVRRVRISLPALRQFALDLIWTTRQLERTATLHALGGEFSVHVEQAAMWAPAVSVYLLDSASESPVEAENSTTSRGMRAFEKALVGALADFPATMPAPVDDGLPQPVLVDIQHVDWFNGRLALGSLDEMPLDYEAYALLLHPIGRDPVEKFDPGPDDRKLRAARSPSALYASQALHHLHTDRFQKRFYWRQLAERFDFPYDVNLIERSYELQRNGQWPSFMYAPNEANIGEAVAASLLRHLEPATGSQLCYFYYCFLYCLDGREEGEVLQGPLTSVMTFFKKQHYRTSSPTFWWPENRSWFIVTGYDSEFTIIGGTRALIDALCKDPDLECFPLEGEAVRQGRFTL